MKEDLNHALRIYFTTSCFLFLSIVFVECFIINILL